MRTVTSWKKFSHVDGFINKRSSNGLKVAPLHAAIVATSNQFQMYVCIYVEKQW